MKYDRRKKRHVATDNFEPHHIKSDSILFLDYLRGQQLREHYLEEKGGWCDIEVKDVDRLLRPRLSREIIQAVLGALRHQQTLLIEYHPVAKDDIRVRVISPNYLVFADNRYHLHAYCHTRQKYLDFVLTRILSAVPSQEEWVSGEHSHEWKEQVTLRFQPNPDLPEPVRRTLLRGYDNSEKGILEVRCNRNEAYYIRQKLGKEFDKDRMLQRWIEITE
jgi:predicted DNA-binding transcriptional regulator YafY